MLFRSSGLVGRFGTLDPTTGGETHRYSLSGEWAKRWESAQSKANAWWLKSGLDLWSNFQYCASNGCPPGDQFKQAERRQAGGFAVSHAMFDRWGGFDVENSIGLQGRVDHLNPVGLYWTSGRQTQSPPSIQPKPFRTYTESKWWITQHDWPELCRLRA